MEMKIISLFCPQQVQQHSACGGKPALGEMGKRSEFLNLWVSYRARLGGSLTEIKSCGDRIDCQAGDGVLLSGHLGLSLRADLSKTPTI